MGRIVGKGNHSVDHIQKIKPRVEQICQELGLQYNVEPNEGRMYINLKGGPANIPPVQGGQHGGGGGYSQHQGGQQQYGGGGYPGQQQQQQHGGQQQNQNDDVEQMVNKFLPRLLRKLEKSCCVVM